MENTYISEKAGIRLRPMEERDFADVIRWRNSQYIRDRFIYRGEFTLLSQKAWYENKILKGEADQLIIEDLTSKKPLGSVYIRDIDNTHHKAEYGIFIGEEDARGRGVGTETAKLMLKYCFLEKALHKVYLRVFSDNEAAIRSYEKAGFVKEGCLKDDVYLDGKYRDMLWMAAYSE